MTPAQSWRYMAAAVRGTSHVATDLPCQDAWICRTIQDVTTPEEEILVLAVSDGAGSASRSAEGAKLACDEWLTLASAYVQSGRPVHAFTQEDGKQWVSRIAHVLALQAQACGVTPRDFACTLVAALISQTQAAFLQIGDGAIVIREEANYRPVFWPQSGEFVNTTYFVTDEGVLDQLQFRSLPGSVSEVAVFSDGLQMLALHYATHTAYAPFFEPLFARLRQEPFGESDTLSHALEEFLDSAAVNQRTDDDKTLVLASRHTDEVLSLSSDGDTSPCTTIV